MSHLLVRGGVAALSLLALLLTANPSFAVDAKPNANAAAESRLVGVVNVNTASVEQLDLLPGVGPVRAGAIIEQRKASGGFKQVDDLMQVSGIGERALESMRPHVAVSGETTARIE